MRCLKDEIQSRGLNVVIPPTDHGPVAANTGHKEWQDKALLQQSRQYRIHRVPKCLAPVSHIIVSLWCYARLWYWIWPPQIPTRPGSALCAPASYLPCPFWRKANNFLELLVFLLYYVATIN